MWPYRLFFNLSVEKEVQDLLCNHFLFGPSVEKSQYNTRDIPLRTLIFLSSLLGSFLHDNASVIFRNVNTICCGVFFSKTIGASYPFLKYQ